MRLDQILCTSFAICAVNSLSNLPFWARNTGLPPADVLVDLQRMDGTKGSNTKRQSDIRSGGFKDLPKELQQELRALQRRDSRQNCGPNRDGNVMTWVPVDVWIDTASLFCVVQAGVDRKIPIDPDCDFGDECAAGWVWQSYDVDLTPRGGAKTGDPGHINFFLHNTVQAPAGGLSYDDCMKYQQKQSNGPDVGKSKCFGSQNNDTRGGAWNVDSFGQVGGYIHSGHVTQS